MKVGDHVRLLYSTDAGKIVRIVDDKTAEVEIEDGFVIPVLLRELVPVSEEEKMEFDVEKPHEEALPVSPPQKEPVFDEILFALEETETGDLGVFTVNESDFTLHYSISGMKNGIHFGLYNGSVRARTFKLLDTCSKNELGKYQKLTFQFIFSAPRCTEIPPPIEFEMQWDLRDLLKKKESVPLLERRASIVKMDPGRLNIHPEALKERMLGGQHAENPDLSYRTARGPEEMVVDLHIEKLTNHPELMTPAEILDLQINTFEKVLDEAVVSGVKRIKFIHGLGKGTLRHTIHKKLSNSALIRYFEDVEKSKFGHGATMIYFK